jgi:hypothetical protein
MYQTASSAGEIILFDYGDFTPRGGESRSRRNTSSTSTNDNDTWTAHVHLFRVLSHGESSLWRTALQMQSAFRANAHAKTAFGRIQKS